MSLKQKLSKLAGVVLIVFLTIIVFGNWPVRLQTTKAAAVIVQHPRNGANGTTVLTFTSTTAGNELLVFASVGASTVNVTVTDNMSQTWNLVTSQVWNTNSKIRAYHVTNTTAGVTTVTITPASGTPPIDAWGLEISGTSGLDVSCANLSASSNQSTCSLNTTATDAMFAVSASSGLPGFPTAGGGFTYQDNATGAAWYSGSEYLLNAAAGSYTPTFNWSASNALGIVGVAFTVTSIDTTPPSVPAGFSANTISTSQINLSWNASTDNVGGTGLAGYHLYLYSGAGGCTPSTQTAACYPILTTTTNNNYSHTGLTSGTTYYYRISAYDNTGNESAWTDPAVSASTSNPNPSPTPPPPPPSGTVVAFPGAEGGGANSVGGRGGTVWEVTNVNDSGAGSLRACIDASGPRTCVFRTGGTISLLSSLTIYNPYITIAGQTAPGGGIQLTGPSGAQAAGNPSLVVKTHNVVIRYLRVRRGHNAGEICNQNPWSCGMSLEILANQASDNAYNIVFDHDSVEWSNYDALGIVGHPSAGTVPRSITVSNSFIGEEFGGAGQTTAAVVGGYSGLGNAYLDLETDIDLHHNLFMGSSHRLPLMTVKSGRLVNNIVYSWTFYPMRSKGWRDFIGNYFKYRSGQSFVSHEIQAWTTNDGNDTTFAPSFYLSGNAGPSDPAGTNNWSMTGLSVNQSGSEASSPLSTTYQRGSPIPTPAGYIPITAEPVSNISQANGSILGTTRTAPYNGAGASRRLDCSGNWVDARDSVDSRIANAVANGTTLFGSYDYSSISNSPVSQANLGGWPTLATGTACTDTDHDGMPDSWEAVNSLNSNNAADGPLTAANGYTNLENYLNGVSLGSSQDTTPPSVPAGLAASVISASQINLSWSTSTDNVGVTGYRVYRGGIQIAAPTTTSYSDTGLTASTLYSYTVAAVDAAGNVSSPSSSVSATTQGTPVVGDINSDHIVNSVDYSILNSKWFTNDAASDLNDDGIVNAIDFSILNANWFKTW
ncbi:MAG: hypothetical protein KW788_02330 [Candidatus Doudnabacteria bacterium]|nr:hypothetical protein [Candidatus Doudnabacteria bacterium]